MKKQWKHTFKVIISVVLILAVPALFFSYIGHDPLRVKENATRTIAVVNEDLGAVIVDETVRFGENIAAGLHRDSDYNWTVLSRSAAESGLKKLKYDAVMYIPSNFSANILTYGDEQPTRATLQYDVQNQLNAVNKEKVLRELEEATHRMNAITSSLYWSYVAQEIDDIRQKFDNILEKEIAFQEAMYAFYGPNSEKLAGRVDQQREQLKHLQENMQQVAKDSGKRDGDATQIEQQLTSFVQMIADYREFQEEKRNFLQESQHESMLQIQQGMKSIAERQGPLNEHLAKYVDPVVERAGSMQKMIEKSNESIENISKVRASKVEQQEKALKELHSELIDRYKQQYERDTLDKLEETMLPLRKELREKDVEGSSKEPPPGDKGDEEEEPDPEEGDREDLQERLESVAESMGELKETLESIPDEKPEQVVEVIEELDGLRGEIEGVAKELREKDEADAGWKEKYEDLEKEHKKLQDEYDELDKKYNKLANDVVAPIIKKIKEQEQSLLNSEVLSAERKKKLKEAFETDIEGAFLEKAIDYYFYLSQYMATVKGIGQTHNPSKDAVLGDEKLNERLQRLLATDQDEQEGWQQLQTDLENTGEEMQLHNGDIETLAKEYGERVAHEQEAAIEELQTIHENAQSILTDMQSTPEGGKTGPSNGEIVLSAHKSMRLQLDGMNRLVQSFGERQVGIINYTNELHKNVAGVQKQADRLNENWEKNVESTEMVQGDVYNVLGNAIVDGQNRGHVYDYLSNPLQVKGEVPSEKKKTVPPFVILVIVLISSLLIGYFSHYYQRAPLLVRGALFALLNIVVGLTISLFGLQIYKMPDERAIMWAVFTILLLTASSTFVRVAFRFSTMIGWFASVGLIVLFITPLLDNAIPNFNFVDPVTMVYLAIQYGTDPLFVEAVVVLLSFTIVLTCIPWVARAFGWRAEVEDEGEEPTGEDREEEGVKLSQTTSKTSDSASEGQRADNRKRDKKKEGA